MFEYRVELGLILLSGPQIELQNVVKKCLIGLLKPTELPGMLVHEPHDLGEGVVLQSLLDGIDLVDPVVREDQLVSLDVVEDPDDLLDLGFALDIPLL